MTNHHNATTTTTSPTGTTSTKARNSVRDLASRFEQHCINNNDISCCGAEDDIEPNNNNNNNGGEDDDPVVNNIMDDDDDSNYILIDFDDNNNNNTPAATNANSSISIRMDPPEQGQTMTTTTTTMATAIDTLDNDNAAANTNISTNSNVATTASTEGGQAISAANTSPNPATTTKGSYQPPMAAITRQEDPLLQPTLLPGTTTSQQQQQQQQQPNIPQQPQAVSSPLPSQPSPPQSSQPDLLSQPPPQPHPQPAVFVDQYNLLTEDTITIADDDDSSPRSQVIVILKTYFMSHSSRYPKLLGHGKPPVLQISSQTWYTLQRQLAPLVERYLYLPKSYVFVPVTALLLCMAWFLCYSIAKVDNSQEDVYDYVSTPKLVVFGVLFTFLGLFGAICGFRHIQKRNGPVDLELSEICLELSRQTLQKEGYRLEYHVMPGIFGTRVLRFVPLARAQVPVQSVQVPTKKLKVPPTVVPIPAAVSQNDDNNNNNHFLVDLEQQRRSGNGADSNTNHHHHGSGMSRQESASVSGVSGSSRSDQKLLLQSLQDGSFQPFPVTDQYLEHLVSILFLLIMFQFIHSL